MIATVHELGAAWCWATIHDGDDVSDYTMGAPSHWPHLNEDRDTNRAHAIGAPASARRTCGGVDL